MQVITNFFGYISGLGANVMMPIILTIFGVCLGAGFGRSLRAGLTVGVGFIGLNLVIGLMGSNLGPAVEKMSATFGLSLSVIDVGWPAAAAIAFGSFIGTVIIPIGLIVNIIMLLTNTTQTVNIDIWNYWHFAFTGALVAALTKSTALGILAAVVNMVIVMVIGDFTAPGMEEYNGLPGISIPHGFSAAFAPVAIVFNKIFDFIPGLNKINVDMTGLQKRFGVFGEPMLVGTFIGIIIGLASNFPFTDGFLAALGPILGLGVTLGAVLVLIPKMAAMLMEGLLPVSDAASEFIDKRFSNRGKIYIGLDSAVGIGHPTTLAISLLLVPLIVFIAVILPGNKVVPLGDLAVIPFIFVLIIPIVKNNGFRAFLIGLITLAVGLWIATDLAPLITEIAPASGFEMPAGATTISSICDGANPLTWAIVRLHGLGVVGTVIAAAIAVVLAIWNRMRILKEAAASHASAK